MAHLKAALDLLAHLPHQRVEVPVPQRVGHLVPRLATMRLSLLLDGVC